MAIDSYPHRGYKVNPMSKSAPPAASPRKIICQNKRAFHDYFISDRYEAGLVLTGSEVKSLRAGKAHLNDAYAELRDGEAFLVNSHIATYDKASYFNHTPLRQRKLLMHRQELDRLHVKVNERGFTLIPLQLYFLNGHAKVELGLAKGKREHDKREATKDKEIKREIAQAMRKR